MRRHGIRLGGFVLALALLVDSTWAGAILSHMEGRVDRESADSGDVSRAQLDDLLDDGDRVHTGSLGRAEIALPEGSLVWLDLATAVEIRALDPAPVWYLWLGRMVVDVASVEPGFEPRVETPGGDFRLHRAGSYRVEVDGNGLTRVAVLHGEALFGNQADDAGAVLLADGYRSSALAGDPPESPFRLNQARADGLDDYAARRRREVRDAPDAAHLPENLRIHAGRLSQYGDWRYDRDAAQWIWVPRAVAQEWQPYRDGRWVDSGSGPLWVTTEPWGAVTYHYGGWDRSPHWGWYWVPGATYAPAWVDWYEQGDYLAWSPAPFRVDRRRSHHFDHDRGARPHRFDHDRAVVVRRDRIFDRHVREVVEPGRHMGESPTPRAAPRSEPRAQGPRWLRELGVASAGDDAQHHNRNRNRRDTARPQRERREPETGPAPHSRGARWYERLDRDPASEASPVDHQRRDDGGATTPHRGRSIGETFRRLRKQVSGDDDSGRPSATPARDGASQAQPKAEPSPSAAAGKERSRRRWKDLQRGDRDPPSP